MSEHRLSTVAAGLASTDMIQIAKAHAYGNDFLYARAADVEATGLDPVRLAMRVCQRHTGLGADGLILYAETPGGARMRLLNADGSYAEVSGNGVRALGALLARARGWHVSPPAGGLLTILTDAGPKQLWLLDAEPSSRFRFRTEMGQPREIRRVTLAAAGEHVEAVCLDMGNPHCVVLDRADEVRLARLGPALQEHSAFPQAVNLELVETVRRDSLRILIWERGVGPTASSGTGSCAAAVAAITAGVADRVVDVEAPGGMQRVEWTDEGVFLTGWAEVLLEGQWVASDET